MATSLRLKFGTASGEKTFNFPNAKQSPSSAAVKNLVQKMIENGSIYQYPPLELHSAVIVVTTETAIDVE